MEHRENGPVGRLFRLIRANDKTGISGTGHVASGWVAPDGSVTLKWHTTGAHPANWSQYVNVSTMLSIHGHKSTAYPYDFTTKVEYVDGGAAPAKSLMWELSEFTYQLGSVLENAEKGLDVSGRVGYLRKSFGKVLDLAQAAS